MRTPIPAIQNLFVVALAAIGLLAGCSRGPMPPTKADAEKFTALMEIAGQKLSAKEQQESRTTDEGHRRAVEKLLVDPFAAAGFDLDATLTDYAQRLHNGNLTEDETQIAILVLYVFQDKSDDLARWGYIRSETRNLIKSVHDKIQ